MKAFRSVLIFSLLLNAAVEASSQSEDSPFYGKIVFIGSSDGTSSLIQMMCPDGTALQTVLKLDDGVALTGRISPDGQRLAFGFLPKGSERCEVWVLDSDGERRKLADEGFARAWSPDGKKLACYVAGEKGEWKSFEVDVTSKEVRPLPIPLGDAVEDWSLDGKVLSAMAGNPSRSFEHSTKGSYPLRQIYLLDINGVERRLITPETGEDAIWSRFSPDGTRIAHYRREYPDQSRSPIESLIIRRQDGSNPRKLMDFNAVSDDEISIRPRGFPCWSPDGKTVAWVADRQRRDRQYLDSGKLREFLLIFVTTDDGAVRQLKLDQEGITSWGHIDWR